VDRPEREQILQVDIDERPDAVVLDVEGEIDGLTAPRLHAAMTEAFDRLGGRPLVVDLTRVTFLGSQGLQVLLDGAREAIHHRGFETLRIVVDHARPVIRPIELTGLDAVLTTFHTVAEALT
jgi:anti-sigma B factor antagonist